MSGQVRLCALVVGPYFLLSGSEDTMMKASLQPDIISFNSALGSNSIQSMTYMICYGNAFFFTRPFFSLVFLLQAC